MTDGVPLGNIVTIDLITTELYSNFTNISIKKVTIFGEFFDLGHVLFKTIRETYLMSFVPRDQCLT